MLQELCYRTRNIGTIMLHINILCDLYAKYDYSIYQL